MPFCVIQLDYRFISPLLFWSRIYLDFSFISYSMSLFSQNNAIYPNHSVMSSFLTMHNKNTPNNITILRYDLLIIVHDKQWSQKQGCRGWNGRLATHWFFCCLMGSTSHVDSTLCLYGPDYSSWDPGAWFNIKISSSLYRKSHCGDKTLVRSSCFHNEISYTG